VWPAGRRPSSRRLVDLNSEVTLESQPYFSGGVRQLSWKLRIADRLALDQAIDTTTPPADYFHVLGAIAEFERDLIRDRVMAGIRRARDPGAPTRQDLGSITLISLEL
jgi:hypothetical protein